MKAKIIKASLVYGMQLVEVDVIDTFKYNNYIFFTHKSIELGFPLSISEEKTGAKVMDSNFENSEYVISEFHNKLIDRRIKESDSIMKIEEKIKFLGENNIKLPVNKFLYMD